MSSIKQLIVNAIIKVSDYNPALDRDGEPTAIEARDMFIRDLMAELFPEDPSVPVLKTKKTKKTAEKVVVTVEKTEEVPVAVADVPVAVAEASPRKKRAPMSDEAKAAMKVKRDATIAAKKAAGGVSPVQVAVTVETAAVVEVAPEPVKEKEKKPRKPKVAKPAADANLAKIDPTWRKHLKHADKDHAKELEPELLNYLNALTAVEFNAKKADVHVADFIAARVTSAVESDGKVETDLEEVEFNDKTYYVNPETKRVYEGEGTFDDETGWTNYKSVGYVGMAAFTEMKMDE